VRFQLNAVALDYVRVLQSREKLALAQHRLKGREIYAVFGSQHLARHATLQPPAAAQVDVDFPAAAKVIDDGEVVIDPCPGLECRFSAPAPSS